MILTTNLDVYQPVSCSAPSITFAFAGESFPELKSECALYTMSSPLLVSGCPCLASSETSAFWATGGGGMYSAASKGEYPSPACLGCCCAILRASCSTMQEWSSTMRGEIRMPCTPEKGT